MLKEKANNLLKQFKGNDYTFGIGVSPPNLENQPYLFPILLILNLLQIKSLNH